MLTTLTIAGGWAAAGFGDGCDFGGGDGMDLPRGPGRGDSYNHGNDEGTGYGDGFSGNGEGDGQNYGQDTGQVLCGGQFEVYLQVIFRRPRNP